METEAVKVSVVILNWNHVRDTITCVQSVRSWSRLDPEIHIVDNSSAAESADLIQRDCPSIRLTRNLTNLGFAGGNNAAIRKILREKQADVVLLLNHDACLAEQDVMTLLQALDSHPEIGMLSPSILEFDGQHRRLSIGGRDIAWHVYSRNWRKNAAPQNSLIEADYISGTVALIRTDVFETIGLFDETYFFSGEMADLCKRAKSNGYLCAVCPSVHAVHKFHSAASLRETLYAYYNLRNRFYYVRKFYPKLKAALIPGWTVCGFLMGIHAASQGKFSKARAVGLALQDGLVGRFGNGNKKFIAQG